MKSIKVNATTKRELISEVIHMLGLTCPALDPPKNLLSKDTSDRKARLRPDWETLYACVSLGERLNAQDYRDTGDHEQAWLADHLRFCGFCRVRHKQARESFTAIDNEVARVAIEERRRARMGATLTQLAELRECSGRVIAQREKGNDKDAKCIDPPPIREYYGLVDECKLWKPLREDEVARRSLRRLSIDCWSFHDQRFVNILARFLNKPLNLRRVLHEDKIDLRLASLYTKSSEVLRERGRDPIRVGEVVGALRDRMTQTLPVARWLSGKRGGQSWEQDGRVLYERVLAAMDDTTREKRLNAVFCGADKGGLRAWNALIEDIEKRVSCGRWVIDGVVHSQQDLIEDRGHNENEGNQEGERNASLIENQVSVLRVYFWSLRSAYFARHAARNGSPGLTEFQARGLLDRVALQHWSFRKSAADLGITESVAQSYFESLNGDFNKLIGFLDKSPELLVRLKVQLQWRGIEAATQQKTLESVQTLSSLIKNL